MLTYANKLRYLLCKVFHNAGFILHINTTLVAKLPTLKDVF